MAVGVRWWVYMMGTMPGGEHVVWGLCGGSCFLTDQQPDSKDKKRSRVRL